MQEIGREWEALMKTEINFTQQKGKSRVTEGWSLVCSRDPTHKAGQGEAQLPLQANEGSLGDTAHLSVREGEH